MMTNNNQYNNDVIDGSPDVDEVDNFQDDVTFQPLYTPKGNGAASFTEFAPKADSLLNANGQDETFSPLFVADASEREKIWNSVSSNITTHINVSDEASSLGETAHPDISANEPYSLGVDFQDLLNDVEASAATSIKPPANMGDDVLGDEDIEDRYDVGYADGAMEAGAAEREKYEKSLKVAESDFKNALRSVTADLSNLDVSAEIKAELRNFCLNAIDYIYDDYLKENLARVIDSKLDEFESSLKAKGVTVEVRVSRHNFNTLVANGASVVDGDRIVLSESRTIVASRDVDGNDFTAVASFDDEVVKASIDVTDTVNNLRSTVMNVLGDDVARLLDDQL